MTFFNEIKKIEDHRSDANKDYDLTDIVFLTMSAVLCGANGRKSIQIFEKNQLDWLREHREFKHAIPTRYSIGRIIRGKKSESIISCFVTWSNSLRNTTEKEPITFDGKVTRGSKNGDTINALQYMTAMVVKNNLIIYQKEADTKTNEIPVMQSILQNLNVKNSVITADALHCQKETAKTVIEAEADYVLQIKGNQKLLPKETKAYFHKVRRDPPSEIEVYTNVNAEHGRVNERYYSLLAVSSWTEKASNWVGIRALVEMIRKRTIKGKESEEISYYLTSSADNVNDISGYIINHWLIENSQHWVLDVTFREDECQIFAEDGARNLYTFRRAILNFVKENYFKDSVAGKMQRATWDQKFDMKYYLVNIQAMHDPPMHNYYV